MVDIQSSNTEMISSSNNHLVFNTKRVLSVCERLNDSQKRRLVRELKRTYSGELEQCGPDAAMFIWAADLFHVLEFLSNDVIWELIDEFKSDVQEYANTLWINMEQKVDKLPISIFAIADRKYVTITGREHFLDVQTMEKHSSVPRQFLEVIHYNLTTLFIIRMQSLTAKEKPGEINA